MSPDRRDSDESNDPLDQGAAGEAKQAASDDLDTQSLMHKARAEAGTTLDSSLTDRTTEAGPPPTAPPSSFPEIDGYEILREIHRGGQGIVYQAVQKATKRKVAIKLLLEGPYASKAARRRFEREIELVAQLKHPHLIAIFHSGETKDKRQFCVMDYVRGVPLDVYVRQAKLSLEDALVLFSKVCDAVNYAHQKGVIHRDLKPSNILVDSDGEPRVLDFGLAKQMVDRGHSVLSLTGQVVGTLPYMSPEQAEGNPDKIDIRTDVYALGVVLYQMLTGHYPYPVAGQMAEVLKHIAETPPTPPSRTWKSDSGVTTRTTKKKLRPGDCPIDDEVQTIVLRSLAKERDRRYQSAGELGRDIGNYLRDEPIEAKKDSGWYVLRKSIERYRRVAIFALVLIVLLAGFAVTMTVMSARYAALAEREAEAKRQAKEAEQVARDSETEQRRLAESEAEARQLAELKTTETKALLKTNEYKTYLGDIWSASADCSNRTFDRARRRLSNCSKRLRNWEWGYLNAVINNWLHCFENQKLTNHSHAIGADDRTIVTVSENGRVKQWDVVTGANTATLVADDFRYSSAFYSPDKSYIIACSKEDGSYLWSLDQHKIVSTVPVNIQSMNIQGSRGVTIGYKPSLWNMTKGKEIALLVGHTSFVNMAIFSPDGKKILTSSDDGTAIVWDSHSGALRKRLAGHQREIMSIAIDNSGRYCATASWDDTARIWDLADGNCVQVFEGHENWVNCAVFNNDANRVATASVDGTAQIWSTVTGQSEVKLIGHASVYSSVKLARFNSRGDEVLTASANGSLRVWNSMTGEVKAEYLGHDSGVTGASYCFGEERIVSSSYDGTTRVWDANMQNQPLLFRGHKNKVNSISFCRDGHLVATASADGKLRVWDSLTGNCIGRYDSEDVLRENVKNRNMKSIDGGMYFSLPASNDFRFQEQRVATNGWLGSELIMAATSKDCAGFKPLDIRFDGVVLGLCLADKHSVQLWNGNQSGSRPSSYIHSSPVRRAYFSPDEESFITVDSSNAVRIWRVDKVELQTKIQYGESSHIRSVAFDALGAQIIIATQDNKVQTWNASTGELLLDLQGNYNAILSAEFSPDGKRILTASLDNFIRIWDAAKGDLLIELKCNFGWGGLAKFSPDGSRIAAICEDHTLRIWDSVPYRERFPRIDATRKAVAKYRIQFEESLTTGQHLDDIAASVLVDESLSEIERTAAQIVIFELRERAERERREREKDDGENGMEAGAPVAAEPSAEIVAPGI